ncbi:MAG TPA: MBL fold metallo-hydrolase [Steroidobacteraceae bacterium]|nr:MBL fold metallo-hydrolase [Steroidobacteraceae bacterium]
MKSIDRRRLLQGALSGALALPFMRAWGAAGTTPAGAGSGRAAAAGPAPAATVTRLNDHMAVIGGADWNVLALIGADGVLLVDSGAPGAAAAVTAALASLGAAPVQTLINTHWHPHATGGNEVFARAGAKIIAHAKVRQWLSVPHWVPAEDRYEGARPKEAWPTQVYYDHGSLTALGQHIDYGYLLEAHTDGDSYVHFQDANVIAVGGVASPDRDPELDWFSGAWVGGRIDALTRLLKLGDARTHYVATTGAPATPAQLQAELDTMTLLYGRLVGYITKGMNTAEMLQAGIMENTGRTWQDPQAFMYAAQKGMWAHYNTLSPEIV